MCVHACAYVRARVYARAWMYVVQMCVCACLRASVYASASAFLCARAYVAPAHAQRQLLPIVLTTQPRGRDDAVLQGRDDVAATRSSIACACGMREPELETATEATEATDNALVRLSKDGSWFVPAIGRGFVELRAARFA